MMITEPYYRFDLRLRSNYSEIVMSSKSLLEIWQFLQDHDTIHDLQVYQYYCEDLMMQDQVSGEWLNRYKEENVPKNLYQIPENFSIGYDN